MEETEKLSEHNKLTQSPIEKLSSISFEVGCIDVIFEKGINYKNILKVLKKSDYKFKFYVIDQELIEDVNNINEYTFKNVFELRNFIYIYENDKCDFANAINCMVSELSLKYIKRLMDTLAGLKLLANYNVKNNVSVKTSTFFNSHGTNCFFGGAERYLLDLYDILKSQNINLDVYQLSEKPFFRKIYNMNVIGLHAPLKPEFLNRYVYEDFYSKNYIYRTFNGSQLHIYSSFQECYPNHIGPSIGISHGISWDSPCNHYSYGMEDFWENKKKYIDSIYYCDKVISVDTNTPNWVQTIDYELGSKKVMTIPNYVDINLFKHSGKAKMDKIIITFPRRLSEPRGIYLVLNVIPSILEKYKNVEFHLVGRGDENMLADINKVIEKFPDNIKCYYKEPNEMQEVYQYTDISLIPTLYSEGTSLSCLEAMASGNIVVATRVGGLTDLIINNYNGYLIEPNEEALKECILDVLERYEEQDIIRKNASQVAATFNKSLWKERWEKQFESFKLNKSNGQTKLVEFYLKSITDCKRTVLNYIRNYLLNGYLVYLRVSEFPLEDNISNGLLQLLNMEEEVVSDAEKIFADSKYFNKIDRKEYIEYF